VSDHNAADALILLAWYTGRVMHLAA
jgi:hypothetical protein